MRVSAQVGLQGAGALDPRKDGAAEVSQKQPVDGQSQGDSPVEQAPVAAVDADMVEMSAEAKALLLSGATAATEQKPEIRQEMVARARELIQSGKYNDPRMLEETAGKLAVVLASLK